MNFIRSALLVVFIILFPPITLASDTLPASVVEGFHAKLLAVMKQSKNLTAKERYALLEPAVVNAFDLAVMIRAASGTYWRKESDDNKKELIHAFQRMSVATYAFRFKGYSGQRFETLKTMDGPRQVKLVLTQIVSPQKEKPDEIVKLTYVTKKYDAGWKIVDVLLDGGISELSVKHSEYRSILKTKGVRGLAELLNKKADQLIEN